MLLDAPTISSGVLAAFGVGAPEHLGGRVREVWRVDRRGGALALVRHPVDETSVRYELKAIEAVGERGWPVPRTLEGPIFVDGAWWTLGPFLPGEPPTGPDEARRRGRLLAEFHLSLSDVELGSRPGFRRAETVLDDPAVEAALRKVEGTDSEEAAFVRWHLERARTRLEAVDLAFWASRPIHGDFTTWNLRFEDGRLSGILDFELTREDHRIAEFNHAWRGKYDAVVEAYDEVSPLEPEEWAALTPLWWLFLIDLWRESAEKGFDDGGWTLGKLAQRSPLMGPDRDPYRAKGTF